MKDIRIVTLNIRRDKRDDGINNWIYRKELVASILREQNPDIAVFQEVLAHQLEDLKSMLPEYQYIGVGRDDGKVEGEFSPIFHKGLSVKDQGTFWLSDTPDIPSCTWPGMIRICTWVSFSGESPFALFNTHLEYEFEATQIKSIDLINERTNRYPDDSPLILTGDFNFNPHTVPYKHLADSFTDSYTEKQHTPSTTYHGWNGDTESQPGRSNRIDYIWHRGRLQLKECRILTENPSTVAGVFPSDHWPVLCDFQI